MSLQFARPRRARRVACGVTALLLGILAACDRDASPVTGPRADSEMLASFDCSAAVDVNGTAAARCRPIGTSHPAGVSLDVYVNYGSPGIGLQQLNSAYDETTRNLTLSMR